MTMVHCEYLDCENNESGLCQSAAVRITPADCCLNYLPHKINPDVSDQNQGDKLTWDQEYIEDDPMDDDFSV